MSFMPLSYMEISNLYSLNAETYKSLGPDEDIDATKKSNITNK